MRRSGVGSFSAPPINLLAFNHLREAPKSAQKIIWREIDVVETVFVSKASGYSDQYEKSLMKTMVEDGNQWQLAADLRAEYAEVNGSSGF